MGQRGAKKYWTLRIHKTLCYLVVLFSVLPFVVSAEELPTYRVFYRPDGGVSITHFVAEACAKEETVTECIDRLSVGLEEMRLGYPYDNKTLEELPPDRANRDKWRGEKGKGVWVDETLITRGQKMDELQKDLEAELDQPDPDPVKVIKYQRLIERTKEISHPVLTKEDMTIFETQKQSIVARIFGGIGNAIGSTVRGIRDGLLAVVSMVTQSLTVGTSSAPAGITAYDQVTGEANCIVIRNGQLTTVLGECTTQGIGSSNTASIAVPSGGGGGQVPTPEIPSNENAVVAPAVSGTGTTTALNIDAPVVAPKAGTTTPTVVAPSTAPKTATTPSSNSSVSISAVSPQTPSSATSPASPSTEKISPLDPSLAPVTPSAAPGSTETP